MLSCLNNEGQPLVGGFDQRGAPAAAACVFFLTLLWLRPLLAFPAAAFLCFFMCVCVRVCVSHFRYGRYWSGAGLRAGRRRAGPSR